MQHWKEIKLVWAMTGLHFIKKITYAFQWQPCSERDIAPCRSVHGTPSSVWCDFRIRSYVSLLAWEIWPDKSSDSTRSFHTDGCHFGIWYKELYNYVVLVCVRVCKMCWNLLHNLSKKKRPCCRNKMFNTFVECVC